MKYSPLPTQDRHTSQEFRRISEELNNFSGKVRVVESKAEAVKIRPKADSCIFITSSDGGLFYGVTGAAAGTYSDDGGSYCGTVFIPTGGDGSSCFARDYVGAVHTSWFMSESDTGENNTTGFLAACGTGHVFIDEATYTMNAVDLSGITSLIIEGSGWNSVLDFSGVSSGTAFDINYSVLGGSKGVTLKNFAFGDSTATSLASVLLNIEGGNTGSSPSQTSAFVTLNNLYITKYNNTSGVGIRVRNISQVRMVDVYSTYQMGCADALVIDNDIDINTGVISINNCYLQARKRGLVIDCNINVLDTYLIEGNYIANFSNADADSQPAVEINIASSKVVSALVFVGNHIEARTSTDNTGMAVLVTGGGYLAAFDISKNHFSCGDSSNQKTYGIQFSNVYLNAGSIIDNEFLRVDASGACVRFENDCTMIVAEPVKVSGVFRNNTAAARLSVESGGNEDSIWNALVYPKQEFGRYTTLNDDTAVSFTVPYGDGVLIVQTNNYPQYSGVVFFRAQGGGSACAIIGGGADFEAATGILAGTTGIDNKVTVSAHTNGKVYIENRAGFQSQFSWTFLHHHIV